jgi:hypothetical protein
MGHPRVEIHTRPDPVYYGCGCECTHGCDLTPTPAPNGSGARGHPHPRVGLPSLRLLLGLSSRWLSSNSHGRFSTPLSNWGLARQLRHEFFYDGGLAAAGSSWLSHRIPVAFVPLVYGVGRRNLLQATELRR